MTPLDADGNFLASSFELLLERLYASGVDGVYVCGNTGEWAALPLELRKAAALAAVRNSPPGKQVIVHIGAHSTQDSVELAKHAARAGAHSVSSLPPSGYYSYPEIRSYYQTLASSSDAPLLIYFVPSSCPAVTTLEQILELCAIPNVIGLKFTDSNLGRMERIKQRGYTIFNGNDDMLASGLLMGADGGIGTFYNLLPELFLDVYAGAVTNDWPRAMAAQHRINELIDLVLRFPAHAAVKRMLTWSGVDCGVPAAPRASLTLHEERSLIDALAKSSFRDAPFARPPFAS